MVLAGHLLSGFFGGNEDGAARRPVLEEVAAWVADRESAGLCR
jgi:hypothetical protein